MNISRSLEARGAQLAALGVATDARQALLDYGAPHFDLHGAAARASLPLTDEPCAATWVDYARLAEEQGAWAVLQARLPQLRFPIREGISEQADYRAATRRGEPASEGAGLVLERPEALELRLHPTPAGRIGVIIAATRADFVSLVQALLRRNEPAPVPESMGAVMVAGFNNWDRIHAHRKRWEEGGNSGEFAWKLEFQRFTADRANYQDRFILLSRGPYSGVSADQLGLSPQAWEQASLALRLEHECTHYATVRLFGAMRNKLHDELLADYFGLVAAFGHYRADWALRFLGLEGYPRYRPGGRLENYRGEPPLAGEAFAGLQSLAHGAAHGLQKLDEALVPAQRELPGRSALLRALAGLSVEDMATRARRGAWSDVLGKL